MANKVIVTKSKLNALATSISTKSGASTPMTIDQMKIAVDNMSGGTSATQHTIHLEFTDSTDTDIDVYYDDALIGTMITAYIPKTYSGKTVSLAQLDDVTWYEPADIPLNTQLIDFTAITNQYVIDGTNGEEAYAEWGCCSDYTIIDPTMTFSYIGYQWWDVAFYDSSKSFISSFTANEYADTIQNDYAHGTLTSARIPSTAMYIRISSIIQSDSTQLSLIRTA